METRLPIPKNWQDFEVLCHKLWRDIWSDANAQKNGRQGQSQNGVDIWGRPIQTDSYAGVQCKDKDGRLGSELSAKELEGECTKACSFKPDLGHYTLATTAPRDESIQEHARTLSDEHKYPFPVTVWSWDDIEEEIRYRPALSNRFYPDTPVSEEGSSTVRASPFSYRDHFEAFFARPDIRLRIKPGLRRLFRSLCYELSDNAFRHGTASGFSIRSEESQITLEDNGAAFNPLEGLDASKLSSESHVGSYVFADFCNRFKDTLSVTYERSGSGAEECNRLVLNFSEPTRRIVFKPSEVLVDMRMAFQRDGAERLAASIPIPKDGTDLLLIIQDFFSLSAIVMFVRCLLQRVRTEANIVISVPRDSGMECLVRIFNDPRLAFVFR